MPRITNDTARYPDVLAYNAAVDGLNEVEDQIAALLETRDRIWQACAVIACTDVHGKNGLPRNPRIFNGELRRK